MLRDATPLDWTGDPIDVKDRFPSLGHGEDDYKMMLAHFTGYEDVVGDQPLNLGATQLDALVTTESVERLGLEPGLRAWAMIKTVAIGKDAVEADLPQPRRWPVLQKTDQETR